MSYMTVILLIVGIILVMAGSNYLVDGSSAIARRNGISEFVIGLTIVGIGTSMPEMVVSVLSSIRGSADMSIGNIIGSNIFNTCMILGITALILPIRITETNISRDIPLNILVTVLLIIMGLNSTLLHQGQSDVISRLDGIFMLTCFAIYMYYCLKNKDTDASEADSDENLGKQPSTALSIVMIAGGLAALIFGGRLFVDNAQIIAKHLGWSDKFIAITILAGGTSLPELATCVVAAAKKKGQMALGNIIGSNISNILLILGSASVIRPLVLEKINPIDFVVMLISALLLATSYFTFSKKQIGRLDALQLLLVEGAYLFYLISNL